MSAPASRQTSSDSGSSDPEGKLTITVMLVDDHPLVRAGLSALIGSTDDLTVVAEAAGGEEAIQFAGELGPDVILMDLSMPGMNGIEATRRVLEAPTGVVRRRAHVVPRPCSGRAGHSRPGPSGTC